MSKTAESLKFTCAQIDSYKMKDHVDIDLDTLYERAFDELGLQQTKRDQIITLYLAIFSFLIPFALSIEMLSWQIKGLIFLAAAIVGILFSLVIIRYRIYKEVYWLCCQSITVLFGIRPEALTKETIQSVYYRTLKKKGKGYCIDTGEGFESPTLRFSRALYVKKNLFSSESIYFFIHSFITALIFAMSVGLICPLGILPSAVVGLVSGLLLFVILAAKYFAECIRVYQVLIDGLDSSFNWTFSKAWFLHFYL